MAKLLNFDVGREKKKSKKPPPSYLMRHMQLSGVRDHCFSIMKQAMKQKNKDEVATNVITWFISTSDRKTLDKFVDWVSQ